MSSYLKDQVFGNWKILEVLLDTYLCECEACGNKRHLSKTTLYQSNCRNQRNCDTCKSPKKKNYYLPGTVFSNYTVIKKLNKTCTRKIKSRTLILNYYLVQCKCGSLNTFHNARLSQLKNANQKHCSDCKFDLVKINEKFGCFTVLEKHIESEKQTYKCQCDCGEMYPKRRYSALFKARESNQKFCKICSSKSFIGQTVNGFIIEDVQYEKRGKRQYTAVCLNCGNKRHNTMEHLRSAKPCSCMVC